MAGGRSTGSHHHQSHHQPSVENNSHNSNIHVNNNAGADALAIQCKELKGHSVRIAEDVILYVDINGGAVQVECS
jgi:hypothetical protein